MPELNEAVARWFEARRGIKPETVAAFGIYTEGGRDIVFPYPDGLRKRRYSIDSDNPFGLEKEGRRFKWEDANGGPTGAGQVPFLPPGFEPRERMILVGEGETDTMALHQAIPESLRDKISIVGLSGVGSWKDRYAEELFGPAKRVFVNLDNDDPYASPDAVKSVEGGWQKIRSSLGKKARRIKLPQGQKDLAEFFMAYDWAAFEVLLKAAAQPKRNYPRIDWSKPVPETDWLVHEMFEMGSVTTLAGEAGLGKSFLTMALALAVVQGDSHYLGQELRRHGPVLYIDEENNEALVRQRMTALGLKAEDWERLEYLSYAGVNLWRNPEPLLEDALDMEPTLVIFDSQKSVSAGSKENDNDEMRLLYDRGFKPLSRQTGAAVVVIHNAGKDRSGPRGGSTIADAADQVITAVKTESGAWTNDRMNLFPSKERRKGATLQAEIVGDLEADGWIRVQRPGDEGAM